MAPKPQNLARPMTLRILDPAPEGHQVAMIVNHDKGQQVPRETSMRLLQF